MSDKKLYFKTHSIAIVFMVDLLKSNISRIYDFQ